MNERALEAGEFRRTLHHRTGTEDPGHGLCLPPTSLRFSLGGTGTRTERLERARSRCSTLVQEIGREGLWVELQFDDSGVGVPHALALATMFPTESPGEWTHDTCPHDASIHRYSRILAPDSEDLYTILQAWSVHDHGGWRGVWVSVIFLAPEHGWVLRPYDDRGADLFHPDASELRRVAAKYERWRIPDSC